MYGIMPILRRRAAGFTLLETMVVVVIIGIMLAVGMPAMSRWSTSAKAVAAVEFYAEGLMMARREALAHNSASRFVLTENRSNGQYDWQVDICFPVPETACSSSSGDWSSVSAPAAGDPEEKAGFLSVFRSANSLPDSSKLMLTRAPVGNSSIYFNAMGWVDPSFDERLASIRFGAPDGNIEVIRPAALVVSLAGTTTRCDPSVAAPDSRACPP